jgi:hypothetical protein
VKGDGFIWRELGIAATEDVAAIRRAYARRLKEADVESDPAAFAALREARDAALARAAGAEPAWEPVDFPGPREEARGFVPDPASRPDREARDPEAGSRESRFAELDALLFASEEPAEPQHLADLTRQILADPLFAGIEEAAGVEAWLADRAASAIPRSDPMLEPLLDVFGWERDWEEWDRSPSVVALVERHRAILFVDYVSRPGHRYRRAWQALVSDRSDLGLDRYFLSGPVARLLELIRRRYPTAEWSLDPYRVALWDEWHATAVQRRVSIVAGLSIGGWVVLRLLVAYGVVAA